MKWDFFREREREIRFNGFYRFYGFNGFLSNLSLPSIPVNHVIKYR